MDSSDTDVAIVGAGSIGVSVAYFLKRMAPKLDVILIDRAQPLAFTSAQSGECYRNWWPHPVMKRFTDRSIDLLEEIALETGNRIMLARRGYVLATRASSIDPYVEELQACYGGSRQSPLRFHRGADLGTYREAIDPGWRNSPGGVDILENAALVHSAFPWLDPEVRSVIHIRRGGTTSAQQLGQVMLERFRELGGTRKTATVKSVLHGGRFVVELGDGTAISSQSLVNAAGPFVNTIAGMLDVTLPVRNVLQQKISFEDSRGAIPRRMPYTIDLDPQVIDWSEQERDLILEDPVMARYGRQMPGRIHCRPDGGENGTWIKMGWAFNHEPADATFEPEFNDHFPEIVLRGAARLQPALKAYYGRLPQAMSRHGGFYTMTEENWPLIGPIGIDGAFVASAMSGFGTMAACAAGELCAQWVLGKTMSQDAIALSPHRYDNEQLMRELRSQTSKGVL